MRVHIYTSVLEFVGYLEIPFARNFLLFAFDKLSLLFITFLGVLSAFNRSLAFATIPCRDVRGP